MTTRPQPDRASPAISIWRTAPAVSSLVAADLELP